VVAGPTPGARIVRFGPFELDVRSGELRRDGQPIALQEQPLRVLTVLVERPGELVTRDELRQRLWPADTYVDFEHGLNAAVKRLRDALGDLAEAPRFVETVPRRGHRFIAPIQPTSMGPIAASARGRWQRRVLVVAIPVVAVAGLTIYAWRAGTETSPRSGGDGGTQRRLTRLTFGAGLQTQPTWSPDGRFVAYASDRAGNFDIWVQAVAGGEPVQVTRNAAHDWQPDWSPNGELIAFRSERFGGGVFVTPALGGEERRITTFGCRPRWSPDGIRLAFLGFCLPDLANAIDVPARIYVARMDGSEPREVLGDLVARSRGRASIAWHPDGRLSAIVYGGPAGALMSTISLDTGLRTDSEVAPSVLKAMNALGARFLGQDLPFAWSPAGDALYIALAANHMRTLWEFEVNPSTLHWTGGPRRLTLGPGPDGHIVISRDGRRLAFTTQPMTRRIWSCPLDATSGRLGGPPVPITPAELEAYTADITPDGNTLVFAGEPAGAEGHRHEIWRKNMDDGRQHLVRTHQLQETESTTPRVAPAGDLITYARFQPGRGFQVLLLDAATGEERPLTQANRLGVWEVTGGWSADGRWVVASGTKYTAPAWGVWLLPVSAAPRADERVRIVTANLGYDLWQAMPSPDGRWLSFVAVPREPGTATLFALPSTGGQWVQLTEGTFWDDKPRWSSDGRYIYFLSSRSGLLNIWAMSFDTAQGTPGEPFKVTEFDDPRAVVSPSVGSMDFGVGRGRIVVPIAELSSSIWMLDNVDR
jgi:Tol biopolymer transport system component/DNA-binding winged helix-turn-helix (wHTH) protein